MLTLNSYIHIQLPERGNILLQDISDIEVEEPSSVCVVSKMSKNVFFYFEYGATGCDYESKCKCHDIALGLCAYMKEIFHGGRPRSTLVP